MAYYDVLFGVYVYGYDFRARRVLRYRRMARVYAFRNGLFVAVYRRALACGGGAYVPAGKNNHGQEE